MAKKILLCADGTWNEPAASTHVYRIFKAISSSATQCPIYDDGAGPDGCNPLSLLGRRDFGDALDRKIKDGYTRISHLYNKGDQVFLFGFSRGAYTARCLAEMISVCGLAANGMDDNLATLAFLAYREHNVGRRRQLLSSLRKDYWLEDTEITMLGVWETVGSRGIPAIFAGIDMQQHGFLDTTLHPNVKHGYHAVAIDERRQEFPAALWSGTPVPGQVIEQVYFAGVHCDVGGACAEGELSQITLGWMIDKARALGVSFDPAVYQRYTAIAPEHALDPKHESWSGNWGFPRTRSIAEDACISNSVHIRLLHDASYRPANLNQHDGVLAPTYGVIPVLSGMETFAAVAAASTKRTGTTC